MVLFVIFIVCFLSKSASSRKCFLQVLITQFPCMCQEFLASVNQWKLLAWVGMPNTKFIHPNFRSVILQFWKMSQDACCLWKSTETGKISSNGKISFLLVSIIERANDFKHFLNHHNDASLKKKIRLIQVTMKFGHKKNYSEMKWIKSV